MHKLHHHHPRIIQTPPDVKVHIQDRATGNTLIKLVSVGATTVGTHYTRETEHWKHAGLTSASFTSSLTLTSDPFNNETQQSLDTFLTNLTTELETSRIPAWTNGKRDTPSGQTAHLYKMTDPDNGSGTVGVLFEVGNSDNLLKAVKFYKSAGTQPTGSIWTTTSITGALLTKQTSLEPKDLDGSTNGRWWWA